MVFMLKCFKVFFHIKTL